MNECRIGPLVWIMMGLVCGELIGGSEVMIKMYQSGDLGEMIEKAKAGMV